MRIVSRRTTRDQEEIGAAEVAAIDREIAIETRILLWPHVAAAAPALVANAPVAHAKRFGRTIGRALIRECATRGIVAVFDPVAQFARRAAANVPCEVRLGI